MDIQTIVAWVMVFLLILAMGVIILAGIFTILLTIIAISFEIANRISVIPIRITFIDMYQSAKLLEKCVQGALAIILVFQLLGLLGNSNTFYIKLLPYDFAGIGLALYWGYLRHKTK